MKNKSLALGRMLFAVVFFSALLLAPPAALATLTEFFRSTGTLSISADAAGSNSSSHIAQVEKPNASATVLKAFVMAASYCGSNTIPDNSVSIDGNPIVWDQSITNSFFFSVRADVTSIVKPIVDSSPPGRIDFTFTETNNSCTDGEILVVVFDDPTQTRETTVILLFGGQTLSGDTFAITLAEPIDPDAPDALADMGLGISFGFQGSGQYSIVEVNGQRVSTSAGGQDDGGLFNGGLITVGGLDDSNANPPDPFATPNGDPRIDDELYSLLPFVNVDDTSITVFTQNPSNDDNILFAYFHLSGTAIIGEGIVLTPGSATNPVGTQHTVTAKVVDDNGNPVTERLVTFKVVSGPHAGETGTDTTDANGEATFTYTGTTAGTDVIEASFVNSQEATVTSNQVTKEWVGNPPVADSQSVTAAEDTPKTITLTGSDAEGDPLSFSIVTPPQHGTLSEISQEQPAAVDQPGDPWKTLRREPGTRPWVQRRRPPRFQSTAEVMVIYTPNPNFNGSDSFTFKVNDGLLDSAPATVSITVTPVNDPPTISDIANQVINEDSNTGTLALTVGDVETPAAALTVTGSSSNLALVPNANIVFGGSEANRTVTVTPAANQNGTATITVTVTDDNGATASDTFLLTVNAVNDAPSFVKGANQSVPEDSGPQSVVGWATAISPGPANESGQVVDFIVTNDNSALFSAQPAIAANGTLTYTPTPNTNGMATVTVKLHDNGGITNGGVDTSAAQTFTITVTPVADPPQISNLAFAQRTYATPGMAALQNYADPDGNFDHLDITSKAKNIPNGCSLLPSDEATINFQEAVNPLLSSIEYYVWQVGAAAMREAAENGCGTVTLEMKQFQVFGVDLRGATSNLLEGTFSITVPVGGGVAVSSKKHLKGKTGRKLKLASPQTPYGVKLLAAREIRKVQQRLEVIRKRAETARRSAEKLP
ncbi:MAG: hypothetical protein A3H45_15770 [Ignavibacteria bacterium RIFCSPLOWO2_02_FULL_55_14]|nr:MAG: hypothetical protein A3H45_15770 [Ignavibacteria bacterium RIFCSPLOWO2_02_FULL_55_14]